MSDALTPSESTLTTPPVPPEGSIVDQLGRARDERLAETPYLQLDLPGVWAGLLIVRYRALTFPEVEELGKRARNLARSADKRGALMLRADQLLMSCVDIHVRHDGSVVPLAEAAGRDDPVRYDQHLAEICRFPADPQGRARNVVFRVFQAQGTDPEGDPVECLDAGQLDAHVDAWDDWQSASRRQADEESEGE